MFGWFKKKRKRPRKENERFRYRRPGKAVHPVDVVPSSKEMQRLRHELIFKALKVTSIAAGAIVLAVWLNGLWVRGVYEHRGFAVGRCQFASDGSLTLARVQQVLGLREDTCVLDVDLDGLRKKLLALPRVQDAEIERRLPDILSIRIQERRPVAWLASTQGRITANRARGKLIDADGWVFESESSSAHAGLPVIDIPDITVAPSGSRVVDRSISCALELLRDAADFSWESPVRIERIQLDVPWLLMADLSGGVHVWLARDNLRKRLAGLDRILTECRAQEMEPEMINLACNVNVPVVMKQSEEPAGEEPAEEDAADETPPALPAHPASPSRSRKGA